MKLSEIFYSLQGEGKRTGFPSFFVRTNYCNLRCSFEGGNKYDTPYTSWEPDDEKNTGEMKVDAVLEEYRKYSCRDVVITGGEPVIQPDELYDLCFGLKKINEDIFITIETNGTQVSDFVYYSDLISLSPKLATSVPYGTEHEKMHDGKRINYEALKDYQRKNDEGIIDIQWKFVITSEKDMEEILLLQKEVGFHNKDVFLMPEGISEKQIKSRRAMVAELCKKHGMNYTDRMHILIWGHKRGV